MPEPNEKDKIIELDGLKTSIDALVDDIVCEGGAVIEERLTGIFKKLQAEKEAAVKRAYNKGYSTAYNDEMRNSPNTVKQAEARGMRPGLRKALEIIKPYTKCRCIGAYTGRDLHEPNAPHLDFEDVKDEIQKAADKGRE